MHLTPAENDRLLIFLAAELARSRRARGLRLNAPEATALIAHTVVERARDGARLTEAIAAGRSVLGVNDVLPGVPAVVGDVHVEAVFDDGTRLAVVTDPFGAAPDTADPGHVTAADRPTRPLADAVRIAVANTADVPISVTSHFHFFEVNARLRFDRRSGYGRHLALPAGTAQRFDPGVTVDVDLVPIRGDRVAIGFAGLVDGPLDAPGALDQALARAHAQGFLDVAAVDE